MAELNTTSPLKRGLKELGGLYVQGAKDFGNRVSNIASTIKESTTKGQGILQTIANQNTQGGNGGQGAVAGDASGTGSKSFVKEQFKIGVNPQQTPVYSSNPLEKKLGIIKETPQQTSLTTPINPLYSKSAEQQSSFNKNIKEFGSAESRPSTYTTPSGETKQSLGGTIYTQDSNGNILKRSPTGEISNVQNRVSTISTGLTPEAIDKYNADKAFREGADRLPPVARAMAYAKRQRLSEERGIERDKALSNAAIQERTLGLNARKEAVQEQRDTARLGLDVAKAQSEAENRAENINVEQSKILQKASENGILDPVQYLNISKQTKQNKLSPQDYMTAFQNQLKGLDATDIDSVRSRIGDIQEEYGLSQSDARNLEEAIMFYNQ